jgi:hypothetical protein
VQLSYIKSLSEAYIIDNKLYENFTVDELADNFYNTIKNIRLESPELYESILESNKFEQQRIFKTYFDLSFNDSITEIVIKDSDLEVLQEDIAIWGLIGGAVKLLWGAITFFPPWMIPLFFLSLIWWRFRLSVGRNLIKLAIAATSFLGGIGGWISKLGDNPRLAYSIIHNNSVKCMQTCDYDPDKEGRPSHYLYQMRQGLLLRDLGRIFTTIKMEEKLECVRMCYLESMINVTKLLADVYFQCLRNTGDISKLPQEKDYSAFQKIILKTQINTTCTSFSEKLSEAIGNLDKSLSLIYHDEPEKRISVRQKLMEDIYQIQHKNTTMSSNISPNRSKSSEFQKQKNFQKSQNFQNRQNVNNQKKY